MTGACVYLIITQYGHFHNESQDRGNIRTLVAVSKLAGEHYEQYSRQ